MTIELSLILIFVYKRSSCHYNGQNSSCRHFLVHWLRKRGIKSAVWYFLFCIPCLATSCIVGVELVMIFVILLRPLWTSSELSCCRYSEPVVCLGGHRHGIIRPPPGRHKLKDHRRTHRGDSQGVLGGLLEQPKSVTKRQIV